MPPLPLLLSPVIAYLQALVLRFTAPLVLLAPLWATRGGMDEDRHLAVLLAWLGSSAALVAALALAPLHWASAVATCGLAIILWVMGDGPFGPYGPYGPSGADAPCAA